MAEKPREPDDFRDVMTRIEAFAKQRGENMHAGTESAYAIDLRRRAKTRSTSEVYLDDLRLTSHLGRDANCLRADEAMAYVQNRDEAPHRVVEHVKICPSCQRLADAVQPDASRYDVLIKELASSQVDDDLTEPDIIRRTRRTFEKLDESVVLMKTTRALLPLVICLGVVLLVSPVIIPTDDPPVDHDLAFLTEEDKSASSPDLPSPTDVADPPTPSPTVKPEAPKLIPSVSPMDADFDFAEANRLSGSEGYSFVEIVNVAGERRAVMLLPKTSDQPVSTPFVWSGSGTKANHSYLVLRQPNATLPPFEVKSVVGKIGIAEETPLNSKAEVSAVRDAIEAAAKP